MRSHAAQKIAHAAPDRADLDSRPPKDRKQGFDLARESEIYF